MIAVELDGTITFTLHCPDARQVELVGAFEGWVERRIAMQPQDGGVWQLTLDLSPGDYLFRYLVNGTEWIVDHDAHGEVNAADGHRKSRAWRPPLGVDPDTLAA